MIEAVNLVKRSKEGLLHKIRRVGQVSRPREASEAHRRSTGT